MRISAFTTYICHAIENLNSAIRQENEIRAIQIGNDTLVYAKNFYVSATLALIDFWEKHYKFNNLKCTLKKKLKLVSRSDTYDIFII